MREGHERRLPSFSLPVQNQHPLGCLSILSVKCFIKNFLQSYETIPYRLRIFNEIFFMTYISGSMPKSPDTKRIEVHLLPAVVKVLQEFADKENRSLKNYIETQLQKIATEKKK
jgi:hypothetical protein